MGYSKLGRNTSRFWAEVKENLQEKNNSIFKILHFFDILLVIRK